MMEAKKQVPKKRFKHYDDDWKSKKINMIAEINPKSTLPESFKYVDLESVKGTSLISYKTIAKENAPSRAQRLAKYNDVFYQTVRPYQMNNYRHSFKEGNFVFSTGYAQIRPFIDSKFLLSKIITSEFVNKVMDRCTGTSFPAINSDDLSKIEFYIPLDESEQQKIGEFFKVLDERIANQERKISKVKALKEAYLTEMFPQEGEDVPKRRFKGFEGEWRNFALDEVAERFDNLRIPITSSKRVKGITPYYGANGIQDYIKGYTHDGENVLLAEDGANDLSNYPVYHTVGKVWVNNHAHVLRGKTNVLNNLFLSYLLKTINMRQYLVGGGRAKLNADVMMKIICKLPDFKEQQKIGAFFKNLDDQIRAEEAKLEKLKKMKEAYLEEMFV